MSRNGETVKSARRYLANWGILSVRSVYSRTQFYPLVATEIFICIYVTIPN